MAFFLRLYRLPELAAFRYDQARDAIAERAILIDHKLTLLGPESVIGDKIIYFGPLHYYLMAPALWAANFDPIGPDVWTAILGVVAVLVVFLATRSVLSAAFMAVFPLLVVNSRFEWNPNTIPLMVALALFFLIRRRFFWTGLFLGLAFQLHFTAGILALLILVKERQKFWWLVLGILVGVLPIIVFDLRHEGLYLRSFISLGMTQYSSRGLNPHYFLWVVPVLAVLMVRIPRQLGAIAVALLAMISLYWLLTQKPVPAIHPTQIAEISEIIAHEVKARGDSFNVASFVDPVTRATSYRYFLELAGESPLPVDKYAEAHDLYVVTFEKPGKILYTGTYEVVAFGPKWVAKSCEWEMRIFIY